MYWTMTHPHYGTWKVTLDNVLEDMKRDYCQHYRVKEPPKDWNPDTDVWFREQWTWVEVAEYGVLIAKPDFEQLFKAFMVNMRNDSDPISYDGTATVVKT